MTYEKIVIPMNHGNRNMHLPWHRQCAVPLHPVKPDCLQGCLKPEFPILSKKTIHSVIFFYNGDHAFGAETVIGFVRDGNLIFKYRLL